MHIASATGTRNGCLFLLAKFTSKVSPNLHCNCDKRLSSWCLLFLGFGALPLISLDISFLCHLLPSWFGTNSLSRSDLPSSTYDSWHPSQAQSDPVALDLTASFSPKPLIEFQLPSGLHASYDCEFTSRCSRKEASGQVVEHDSQFDCIRDGPPLCCRVQHLLFPWCQQLCHVRAKNVPPQEQDCLQHSSKPGGHFWFPACHHPTSTLPFRCPLDCSARCPALLHL